MRIVSGEFKGRRFMPPKNLKARPTTDVAKEGLFDILSHRVDFQDLKVLDMFGGTGSISLEFVSRGCRDVTLTEKDSVNYAFIRKVIGELKAEGIRTYKTDVFKFVQGCNEKFDLIFADPPYALAELPTIPDLVMQRQLLAPDGLLILEHPKEFDFSENPFFEEHRNYGHVNFSFFLNKANL